MRFLLAAALCSLLCVATPVSASEPPPLDAYGDLPKVEQMALSSNGMRLAMVTQIKQERRLVLVDNDKVLLNTAVADLKIRGMDWAGDDFLVVEKSDTVDVPLGFTATKYELFSAIIVNPAGGKVATVFADSPSMSSAIFGSYGFRKAGEKWTGLYSGIKYKRTADRTAFEFDHGRPFLFAVDLADNKPRQVARSANENHRRSWLVDGTGEPAATIDMAQTGDWTIENAAGRMLTSGFASNGDVWLVSFGKTADTLIYAMEDREAGTNRYFEVPLVGGEIKEQFLDVEFDRLLLNPFDSTLLGYITKVGGKDKPTLLDPRHQAIFRSLYRAFPNLDMTLIDWSQDFGKFIVLVRGNGDSGTYYSVDLTGGKADPIGYERPSIHPKHVGAISTVTYKAADGLDLDGILTLPPGRAPKNLPLVMLPHGGPSAHDIETFDWWAQAFASRGYAVFQPNFRGSTNRDNAFRDAGEGQWGRKMQTDISDGLAELAKRGIVDPRRACIMGASYGGYAALAGVTLQKGLDRCAVAVAPVSDLADFYHSEYRESGQDKMLRRNFRQSLGDPKTFDEISPRKNAARADAPILLIHGKDDIVVRFNHSTRMADALKAAGKPFELVELREEDHWLSNAATRKQMLQEAMRFVQQHNPADPAT